MIRVRVGVVALLFAALACGRREPTQEHAPTPAAVDPIAVAAADASAWPSTMSWDRIPIDVGSLNHRPAGIHGRLRAEGDALVFADGTPARLWGANLAANALFSADDATIAAQARRLAALGFNLVRIHHHDSGWVSPNVFVRDAPDTDTLDRDALARIDRWIAALAAEGIYVWLDLHVGREFRPGDGLAGWDELARQRGEVKGFSYVDREIEAKLDGFARAWLEHENVHTGRRLADDPAIVAVLVTNENDLCHHFGNAFAPDEGNPHFTGEFEGLARVFAERHGVALERLRETWQPGPAKRLLADLEAGFFRRSFAVVRKTGFAGLVVGTNYWGGGLDCVASLTTGDLIDAHGYGDAGLLRVDPRQAPTFLAAVAAAQVAGMPFTLSEWNVPPPVPERFAAAPMVAAMASLQGWDAAMLYAYMQERWGEPRAPSPWSSLDDPAVMALLPAAAIAYREGHIAPARTTYRVELSPETLFDRRVDAASSLALRTLAERSRIVLAMPDTPELDWDRARTQTDALALTDLDADHLAPGATAVRSDTGEIERRFGEGVFVVDTPRSQIAAGELGGRELRLGDVVLMVRTPAAAIAVTALDGQPIAVSRRILISAVARTVPSADGRVPVRAEPVEAELRLRSSHVVLRVAPQANHEADNVTRRDADGWHRFALPVATHWSIVEPATPSEP